MSEWSAVQSPMIQYAEDIGGEVHSAVSATGLSGVLHQLETIAAAAG